MKTCIYLALLALTLILTACPGDRACNIPVNYVADISNQTGRDLSLRVCRGTLWGQTTLTVPAAQSGKTSILSNREPWVYTGGPSNACDAQTRQISVALTTQSFQDVKFCYQKNTDAPDTVIIVEVSNECPAGAVEQTAPVDKCVAAPTN